MILGHRRSVTAVRRERHRGVTIWPSGLKEASSSFPKNKTHGGGVEETRAPQHPPPQPQRTPPRTGCCAAFM